MMLSQAGLTVHEQLLVRTTGIVIRTVTNLQIGEGVGKSSFDLSFRVFERRQDKKLAVALADVVNIQGQIKQYG